MIWLIGNRGMLGREVESLLQRSGIHFTVSDRDVDIVNLDALLSFSAGKPITWIVNCAAYTAVDKAEDESDLALSINAEGPKAIATIAKELGARLIHISTDYVFDGTKPGAYDETDQTNPLGVYGRSKQLGELNISETLGEFFIIRTSWLFGRQGNNFVYTMLRLFQERDEISVVGDQSGGPTFAPDLAAAILTIIRSDSHAYGIYHYSNEGKVSWHEFACEIYRIAKERSIVGREVVIKKITSEEFPTKTPRPRNSYLSTIKFAATFNMFPRNWKSALGDFLSVDPS